jgi:hypothetical protein
MPNERWRKFWRKFSTGYLKFFVMLIVFFVAAAPLRLGLVLVTALSNRMPSWLYISLMLVVLVVGFLLIVQICRLAWKGLKDFSL